MKTKRILLILILFSSLLTSSAGCKQANEQSAAETIPFPAALSNLFTTSAQNANAYTSLKGKVVTGYQGWFSTACDGHFDGKWVHWSLGGRAPDAKYAGFDGWPQLKEYPARPCDTGLRYPDGQKVNDLFSSAEPGVVDVHFEWMRDYGIDGAFLQMFVDTIQSGTAHGAFRAQVLKNVHNAARRTGRGYAIMYDLSSSRPENEIVSLVQEHWKSYTRTYGCPADRSYYMHHRAAKVAGRPVRPVVALWGAGVRGRNIGIGKARELMDWLRRGGDNPCKATVMGGVPYGWRTYPAKYPRDAQGKVDLSKIASCGDNSAPMSKKVVGDVMACWEKTPEQWKQQVFQQYDIISPWTVGRYRGTGVAGDSSGTHRAVSGNHYRQMQGDMAALAGSNDYLPVVFPGFSWHNLKRNRENTFHSLNHIPRGNGSFFWQQIYYAWQAGAQTVYVAMFDEVDEATSIFKMATAGADAPLPEGYGCYRVKDPANCFLTLDIDGYNLPDDWFLRLSGQGARLLRGESNPQDNRMPIAPRRPDLSNRDGFALVNGGGSLTYLHSDGAGALAATPMGTPRKQWEWGFTSQSESDLPIGTADVNGDGRRDVLLLSWAGKVHAVLTPAPSEPVQNLYLGDLPAQTSECRLERSLGVGKFRSDRVVSLAFVDASRNFCMVHWNGNGFETPVLVLNFADWGWGLGAGNGDKPLGVSDVNGDGLDDIVIVNHSGKMSAIRSRDGDAYGGLSLGNPAKEYGWSFSSAQSWMLPLGVGRFNFDEGGSIRNRSALLLVDGNGELYGVRLNPTIAAAPVALGNGSALGLTLNSKGTWEQPLGIPTGWWPWW